MRKKVQYLPLGILWLFICSLFTTGLLLASEPVLAETTNQPEDWQYVVNKNESFERIYQKYLVSHQNIAALSKYNHHPLSKKLQPGQVLKIPVSMIKKTPSKVQVLVVTGDVFFTNTATSIKKVATSSDNSALPTLANKQKLTTNDVLAAGTIIETGNNSLAKIQFSDGSITNVQPNSILSIQESYRFLGRGGEVVLLKLTQGRTEITANPTHETGNNMQIQTPSAIAAVRGTQFRAGAEGIVALQETLDGQVAFSASGQEVLIDKGFGSTVEKEKAPSQPIVLPAAPDVSAFTAVVDDIPVQFNLAPQADAVAWVSQLALDAGFTQILNQQTVLMPETGNEHAVLSFGDLVDGQYYLKLRAKEVHGLQGNDALHAFKVSARPLPPMLISPPDAAVIEAKANSLTSVNLSWSIADGAQNYIVQIAKDANFENKVFERITSFNQLLVQSNFMNEALNTIFYWRVAALSQGKPQKFSKSRSFTR